MIHFVGIIKFSQQYYNAVRVWGYPDFTHARNDPRFRDGGEVEKDDEGVITDLVIIGKDKIYYHSYDDSENN